MKINVLDHGFVRLVSYMQPVPEGIAQNNDDSYVGRNQASWTGDLEIVRNARVSYDADWRTGDDEGKDKRLIHRMMEGRHSSPFEAMVFTFEVKAPIFVFRQWHRHRTWSYNEVSARYAELPEEYYCPIPIHIGEQSKIDKQMRELRPVEPTPSEKLSSHDIRVHGYDSFKLYKDLLSRGVPREIARGVLPMNTYSRMFATVDLHNLFHFLRLRLDAHAQYEIRVYAEALLELITSICPIAIEAFKESRK